MSEQEKKSGAATGGSSVVMVEQTTGSRHKQPYRPTELQEETPDLHHKRSRAPAVPSVAEELKGTATDDTKERKECERAMSSEKHKHNVAKKLSSSTKRRGSSPETITLAPIEVETKKGTVTPPTQPIPADVKSVASAASHLTTLKQDAEKRTDSDSITEEIAELRTPEAVKKHSEWEENPDTPNNPDMLKKKVISWNDDEYLDKVQLQDLNTRSRFVPLQRTVSLGPCFRSDMQLSGGPSGIMLCVPKKSVRSLKENFSSIQSGINITISKKYIPNKSKSLDTKQEGPKEESKNKQNREGEVDTIEANFFGTLKSRLHNVRSRIRNIFNA